MPFELFIAGRYLRARRKQTFISLITLLSVAGVSVGVMALVIVIAVMTGAESDFRSRILGVESHIMLMRHGGGIPDPDALVADICSETGVSAASPFVYSQVMLRSARGMTGAMLRGVDPASDAPMIEGVDPAALETAGSDEGLPGVPGIVIGRELAASLVVAPGEMIHLMSPKGILSPMGHIPTLKRFKVTGIFESGMYEYDSALAYVHITEAQNILRLNHKVTGIGIWVSDLYQAGAVRDRLAARYPFPYSIRDWMQMNQSLFSALKLEKTAMFIILTLIILVAAFNIASSLIMMVMEKTRDIAILKTMGADNRLIRRVFIWEGLIIGGAGTLFGLIGGVAGCFILKRYTFIRLPQAYPFTTLPIQLEAWDVCMIAVSALLICFLSTLYPAFQASKLEPVEAIRYG
ncbi:MAG: lipoprotein-releasing system transmembrane subunit LolC [Deltaproteobacteria bacterium]|nr:MAG: lipoprotein-releasing system transmembrane subunit LolC [Deltaproteobacteria bacterium]